MYVVVRWNSKKTYRYVLLMENHWDKEKCRSASKRIKTLGIYEELVKEDPDAIAKLKAQYARETKEKRLRINDEMLRALRANEGASDKKRLQRFGKSPLINYSCYILKVLWRELGLDYAFGKIAAKSSLPFDLEKTVLLMAAARLADPCSELPDWERRFRWVGACCEGVETTHLYEALDVLNGNRDGIVRWMKKKMDDAGLLDLSILFCAAPDLSSAVRPCGGEKGGDFFSSTPLLCDRGAIGKLAELRESRPDGLPRFDMLSYTFRLAADRNGIPIDYEIFSPGTPDRGVLPGEGAGGRAVIFTGSGGHSLKRALEEAAGGGGFIAFQDLERLDPALVERICNPYGWTSILDDRIRIKEIECDLGKERPCRLIVTINGAAMTRDYIALVRRWKEAEEAVRRGVCADDGNGADWAVYVKRGADGAAELNEDRFRRDLRLIGMWGVVCCQPPDGIERIPADAIVKRCADLALSGAWFRNMIPAPSRSLILLHSEEKIGGFALLCFIAVVMLNLLRKRLDDQGTPLSCEEISRSLASCVVVPSPCLEKRTIFRALEALLPQPRLATLRFKGDEEADGPDLLLRAVGLAPIEGSFDRNGLARCLKTKFRSDSDVCPRLRGVIS